MNCLGIRMNDFTKDELQSLKFHVDTSLAQDDDTEGLMIKIQSLIDNYCDCTEIKTLKDIDGVEIVDYCANCGRPIE